ncbi:MAG: acyl transferase [Candidatus Pseudobacter hemicellulosilyticus]|uniref:Acyl transferase n=1 Tax=Candidatus Pseudobacter hemicellulosilyticus TaxID=3121375 RepID=A0AAJ6BK94_9BACT|nr:MAG: acyl transferase [Pseudobacter sp.]
MNSRFEDTIFLTDAPGFEALALDLFRFQYQENPVYQQYVNALGIVGAAVTRLADIPFLPIRFFKTHPIQSTVFSPQAVFESSGTTGSVNSRHLVRSLDLYRQSFNKAFELFYGPVRDWCVIGLLPSYLERSHSSLVVMVDELIRLSGHPDSGFYLYEHAKLQEVLQRLEAQGQRVLLIGVTFALLDLAGRYPMPLQHTVIMETGGMKGRREEMTRQEVHALLGDAFGLPAIHSEYGMTELLSQAYSAGQGLFRCPPWMRVLMRQEDDPFDIRSEGTGIVNVIDLANVYSCSFIATDDVGRLYADGSFEVQGRLDNSDIRGCSLMVTAL